MRHDRVSMFATWTARFHLFLIIMFRHFVAGSDESGWDHVARETCNHLIRLMLVGACLLTYLLTYAMVQGPSWEANWFAASQEIPRISRNPKVHYRTHKRPPPVSILGQPYPVHIPTFHLLEIHPNIIHPSTPRSPQWSPSIRFPQQDPIHPPLLTHARHMTFYILTIPMIMILLACKLRLIC